jgi:hypothetical protein
MPKSSPNDKVVRGSLNEPADYVRAANGSKMPKYRCEACGSLTHHPFVICERIQICDSCCKEVAELWHYEHSGSWILHSEGREAQEPRDEFVYLAQASTGEHKIGWSTDPRRRVGSFDAKMPISIDLNYHFKCDDAREAESRLHQMASDRKVKGEWFDLTEPQVSAITMIRGYKHGDFLGPQAIESMTEYLKKEFSYE